MIKNDGRILKNGNTMFIAQIVDSFVQFNSPYYSNLFINLTGTTPSNPFKLYYEAPAGVQKYTYTNDGYFGQSFQATGEGSYKDFYFSGNLQGLTSISFDNPYYSYGYSYRGDLIKLMNQFPELNSFKMNAQGNTYYNYSTFNQDLSNTEFPANLELFHIADNTLSGNINTITNFNKISDLELVRGLFTGDIGNASIVNLTKLGLNYLPSLAGSLNNVVANNPNLDSLTAYDCYLLSGNATALDISKLKYVHLFLWSMPSFTGDVTNWTFNTGITTFQLYNRYLDGNLTNWNIGNTHLSDFLVYGNPSNYPTDSKFSGNLSGWTLPSTLNSFQLYFSSGITSAPINYTGCTNFNSLTVYSMNNVNQNINDFKFNNKLQSLGFYNYYGKGKLYGNISAFVMPTGMTYITMMNSNITGNITSLMLNNIISGIDINSNFLSGNITNMTFPNSLTNLNVGSNSGVTFNLSSTPYYSGKTSGVFHTKNINYLYFDYISGITGNLSNFVIDNTLWYLSMNSNNNFYSDLSKLDASKIYYLYAQNCPNLYGDLSNWLTGTTNLNQLVLDGDYNISGDTTGWNVNSVTSMRIQSTKLSGNLKLNNVYWLTASGSKINSNIATDFNFSNQAYYVDLTGCENLTGNLSGVSLCFNQQYLFYIGGCTGVTGSNSFIDYLFANRKNFKQYSLQVQMNNIGDSVSGGTPNMGDLGTYTAFSGVSPYYMYDLSESQVNFLVAGLDYTGTGTNIPWTQAQKVWWMENAKISSVNLNNRYIYYNIYYW